jgi:hypothetical protein
MHIPYLLAALSLSTEMYGAIAEDMGLSGTIFLVACVSFVSSIVASQTYRIDEDRLPTAYSNSSSLISLPWLGSS